MINDKKNLYKKSFKEFCSKHGNKLEEGENTMIQERELQSNVLEEVNEVLKGQN